MLAETAKPGQESIPGVQYATSFTRAGKSAIECTKQVLTQCRMRHRSKQATTIARASAFEYANMQDDTRQQAVETTLRHQGNLCIRQNM